MKRFGTHAFVFIIGLGIGLTFSGAYIYSLTEKQNPKPVYYGDYQIQVNENGVTLMDGSRYVGFIKWVGKASALDSLILNDNR